MRARQSDEMEISEAGQAVLDRQLSSYTGLSAGEQAITIDVDSGNFDAGSELDAVAANLGLLLAGPV